MARKDVEKYYDDVAAQYSEMLENIREVEEAVQTKLVSPDFLGNLQKQIAPMKENYMRISYIMFLLNKPSKLQMFIDKVLAKFNIQTKTYKLAQKVDKTATLEAVKEENKKSIDNIKV